MSDMKNSGGNATETASAITTPVPVIQMSECDLEQAVKSLIAQMAPAAQAASATGHGGSVVVQVSAEDMKRAVHDSIMELQKDAVASSKIAIVGLLTLPCRALNDWLHWLKFGDVDPDAFGKPAGSKVWPPIPAQPADQAGQA